ncbi:hypothetical protein SAMN05518668_111159 [Sphingobium sp. YR657]|nr:hypothetical protein SAMN05518668_111159 [Sphingobium sp. YR657]
MGAWVVINASWYKAVPTGNGADSLLLGIALRDDRGLHFRRPVPPLACTGKNLEPLNLAGASIVTWHRHSTSVLHPDQEAQTQGYTLRLQGGAAAPLTNQLCLEILEVHRLLQNLDWIAFLTQCLKAFVQTEQRLEIYNWPP